MEDINEKENAPSEETKMHTEPMEGSENMAENDNVAGDELTECQQKVAELNDRYIRLAAEFDNYRKRTSKEIYEMRLSAGQEIIKQLLEVLDDSDRCVKDIEVTTNLEQSLNGAKLVLNKFISTITNMGVQKMDVIGQEFDSELHEAITQIPVTNEADGGKVMDVIQNGYKLNDKLIRHAKVVIGQKA